jgi:hypothetical protein
MMTKIIEMRLSIAIIGLALIMIGLMGGIGIVIEHEMLTTWSGPSAISVPGSLGLMISGLGFSIIAYREKYWEQWHLWNKSDRR